jgi:hypothetical protein
MTRTFVHYTIEKELSAGLTDKDLVEINAYIQVYKRTKFLRMLVHWVFGDGTKQVDFVTRGIEGYLSLPQGWLIWVIFSWLPAVIIAVNYSPDLHFGIVLIASYGLASVAYAILRILVENWFAEWQMKQ